MSQMSNVILVKQNEQSVLMIRARGKVGELQKLIGESYGKIIAYLDEMGEMISDIPYVAYHNMDMQDLDMEMGFPVPTPLPGKGEIQAAVIQGGTQIFCMNRGPYSKLQPVYDEMQNWMDENEYHTVGPSYEFYYNDRSFPSGELLTKIMMVVEKGA